MARRILGIVLAGSSVLTLAQVAGGQEPKAAPRPLPPPSREAPVEPVAGPYHYPVTSAPASVMQAAHVELAELSQPALVAEPMLAPGPVEVYEYADAWPVHPVFQPGLMFRYDTLLFTVTQPDDAVVGNPNAEHVVIGQGIPILLTNSLTTNWDHQEYDVGHRFEFGWHGGVNGVIANLQWFEQSQGIGAGGARMVFDDPEGYLLGYQDANGDGLDDDVNGNNIYGRNGQDLGTPSGTPPVFGAPFDGEIDQPAAIDTGDLVEYEVVFDDFEVSNTFEMWGGELMGVTRLQMAEWWATDLFYGFRYLEANDEYALRGSGGALGASHWSTDTENRIFGPQVGGRIFGGYNVMTVSLEGRFLAGFNHQNTELEGEIASDITEAGAAGAPANLITRTFNADDEDEEFSPVGEVRLDTALWAYRWLAFHVGYNAIIVGNVSRAVGRIEYTLPELALTAEPDNDTVFLGALNLGVEIRR